ncbi:hypothetical protein [Staphylococcus saprophyticus]|uniref:hypothetical protein n=1 Tax=Staphylococcus saprophyticus TaxID=29385 RepID=UPI001565C9AF|nr:hypothetical protein [Staphylococcus saprophyticus]
MKVTILTTRILKNLCLNTLNEWIQKKQKTIEMAQDDPNYEDFLRGQVTARQKGEDGNY